MSYKRITLEDRLLIQEKISSSFPSSFRSISKEISKDPSSVSREILRFRTERKSASHYNVNRCYKRTSCHKKYLCRIKRSYCENRNCAGCGKVNCNSQCAEYREEVCALLKKPPYVCNPCSKIRHCHMTKQIYHAREADKRSLLLRKESRSGINMSEAELKEIDELLSPRIKLGQSVHHIFSSSPEVFPICEKQAYNLIHAGLLSAIPLDMPRAVRMRPRKRKSIEKKVDRNCRKGRTYEDYLLFLKENPDTAVLQGDTVEGIKGGRCILTLTWIPFNFQIGFLRDHNTAASVTEIVDRLKEKLSSDFLKVFPEVWLLDNGSEFSDPEEIEKHGVRVFYCDPSSPYQKGACENTHEQIRRILPKGTSFDDLDQDFFDLLFSHTNSFNRKKLNDHCPLEVFLSLNEEIDIKELFGICKIDADKVNLTPALRRDYLSLKK